MASTPPDERRDPPVKHAPRESTVRATTLQGEIDQDRLAHSFELICHASLSYIENHRLSRQYSRL